MYLGRKVISSCRTICLLLILLIPYSGRTQYHYLIESEGQVSEGGAAFWLVNNRQGLSSLNTQQGYVRAGFGREMSDTSLWGYRYGIDMVKSANYPGRLFVQQVYGDIRYKNAILSIGSKERWGILKNPALSSGGMSWSGNARPIPQVRLESNGYVTFPWLLHRYLKVSGSISYGAFTDEGYVKERIGSSIPNVLYHGKTMILTYDFPKSPWSATLGLESYAQFGGSNVRLKDYFMVLVPCKGDESSSQGDQIYIYGSTRGSWNLVATRRYRQGAWKAYFENFFDDYSGLAKLNGTDGLWGIEYSRQPAHTGITGLVYEYLHTTDQSGAVNYYHKDYPGGQITASAPTGTDNYYNSAYNGGWSHWGMVNGNPLITSPVYGENGVTGIFNNRIIVHHIGLSGQAGRAWSGRVLATYTRGWGTYKTPFTDITRDFLTLLEVSYAPRWYTKWQFTLSGSINRGDLYGDHEGLALKVRFGN